MHFINFTVIHRALKFLRQNIKVNAPFPALRYIKDHLFFLFILYICCSIQKKLIVEIVKIQKDGTVEVDLTKDSPVASELLELQQFERASSTVDYITIDHNKSIPKLKIAVLVVGTRGDVQPFLAVARRLQVRHDIVSA